MKSWFRGFNIYLLALALGLGAGCKTTDDAAPPAPKKGREFCLLRFFIEANPDPNGRNSIISLFAENPVRVCIEPTPALTEVDVAEVSVLDQMGGFSLAVKFTDRGARVLEMVTGSHPGKRLAVFAEYSVKGKSVESRWLAAPRIPRRIVDGTLVFVPDATREESVRIAEGMANLLADAKRRGNL